MTSAPPGTYALRRAAGLCGRCGGVQSQRAYCEECRVKREAERGARRSAKARARMCIEDGCELAAIRGQRRCEAHQAAANASSRASHARAREG